MSLENATRLCGFCGTELDEPIEKHLETCDDVQWVNGVPVQFDNRTSYQATLTGGETDA